MVQHMSATSPTLRSATEDDVPHLARLLNMAFGGLLEAAYADVTDAPLEKLLEWRFLQLGSIRSYEHCLIAQSERVAGMLYAFPIGELESAPSDPRITPQGQTVLAPAVELHHQVPSSSYYISALAVYPEFRGAGAGKQLMAAAASDALRLGFPELSLLSFEQNALATPLYQRLGFKIAARRKVAPHPLIRYAGDLLLMTRQL